MKKYILKFSELSMKDVPMVGGKNASLGEMYNKLVKKGINIPHGFAVTAEGFKAFLQFNEIDQEISKLLKSIDYDKLEDLKDKGRQIRQLVLKSEFPKDLEKVIIEAYKNLSQEYDKDNLDVAIRSSATAEDLPIASFAGQLESFLNVKRQQPLLAGIKKCFASLYGNRTISYVHDQGFKYDNIFLSVGIQKMVRSDKASAGVSFTVDTETGFKDIVLINSAYGLGENVVKGRINPDQFYIFKPTLGKDFKAIISKELGSKEKKLVYKNKGKETTANIKVELKKQNKFSLTDKEILKLAKWSVKIETLYDKPMDIEWAKDGLDNKLYIVQARPETVSHKKDTNILEEYILQQKGKVLCQGNSIGEKIGQGKVKVIKDVKNITDFKKGDVLVTTMTDPDWEPVMKKAAAIVTDLGGRTSHAAIVSRELGVPAVVGTKDATQVLKDKNKVTVSCAEGEKGYIYQGILDFKVKKTNLKKLPEIKTKIMMILAEPNLAFKHSFLPSQGVGLARIEFIIANNIKVHPLALLNFKKLDDKKIKDKINKLTLAFDNKKQYYIDKLAWGMAKIAAAFYPQEVIVRFSDFKTNEYGNLIGGESFEPQEANPMIGWRGASRYYDDKFKPAFELECQAVKKVRQEMGLKNLKVMVPFCRTIEEGKKVLEILKANGLKSGQDDLQIYVMIEIPSNVLLADEFAQIFDGFSIGSNDLTQLTLGLDRDSELISDIADERNEAVKKLIAQVIKTAKKNKIKIGICGQAPSDFPNFARFLMKQGIDSISLNPDTVIKTRLDLGKSK